MSRVELSPETGRRLDTMFRGTERQAAIDLLVNECAGNLPFSRDATAQSLDRIRFAVLKLSQGELEGLQRAVDAAKRDWRDVLVAAGFANDVRAHEAWFPDAHAV